MLRRKVESILPAVIFALSSFLATSVAQAQVFNVSQLGAGAPGDAVGTSVAVAANIGVVGAVGVNKSAGAATVYAPGPGGWRPQTTLTAADGMANDNFGNAVAVSGSTIVVGAHGRNKFTGAVYIYAFAGGKWSQQTSLTPANARPGDNFGYSVALQGNILVVGAPGHAGTGAAYVYTQSKGVWTWQTTVTPTDAKQGDQFATSLSLGAKSLLVGAPRAAGTGAAYLFVPSGKTVSLANKLTGTETGSGFGTSLLIQDKMIVVGAPGTKQGTGAVAIYTETGSKWTLSTSLVPPDATKGSAFGSSVYFNGITLAIAATNPGISRVYGYAQLPDSWYLAADVASFAPGDRFGSALAITGNTVVVGAPGLAKNGGTVIAGQLEGIVLPGSGAYGTAVSAFGNSVVIGAPKSNGGKGGVAILALTKDGWAQQTSFTAFDAKPGDDFGGAVSLVGNTLVVGAPGHSGTGAVYVYTFTKGAWSQQAEFTPKAAKKGDLFGVSVSASTNTILVGAPYTNKWQGAAYIYTWNNGWNEAGALSGSQAGEAFGASVSLSGASIAIGSPFKNKNTGEIAVYTLAKGKWNRETTFAAYNSGKGDYFSTAINLLGDTLAVGAPGHNTSGAVYIYLRAKGAWTETHEFSAPDAHTGDRFGFSLSYTGRVLAVGAYGKKAGTGQVYAFVSHNGELVPSSVLIAANGQPKDSFGFAVAAGPAYVAIGAPDAGNKAGAVSIVP